MSSREEVTQELELAIDETPAPEVAEAEATTSMASANKKRGLCAWIPIHFKMAALSSVGIAIVYGLKVNLSVAIVAMVNHTALEEARSTGKLNSVRRNECGNLTEEKMKDGPLKWDEPTQGIVLGSYFWGYMLSQIPGGYIAERFSAKWVMWSAVMVCIFFTMLSPLASKTSYVLFTLFRAMEGLASGTTLPALHVLIARWAPPNVRSTISSVVYAGMSLGTVISMWLAGVIAVQMNWEAIFYVMGGLSSIWCVVWIFAVYDDPERHPRITIGNMYVNSFMYDMCSLEQKKERFPLTAVLTSMPFYAIAVSHVLGNWAWYMLLIQLPTFMNQVLQFKLEKNAGLSALPFLCMWFFSLGLSSCLDWLTGRRHISTTTARKVGTIIATIIPAGSLLAVGLAGCNRAIAVTFMTIGVMCLGAMFSGYLANHIDIAPNFAGMLMGLTNTAATIPGFIAPIFVGMLTHNNQTVERWRIIFYLTSGLLLFSALFYALFGSGTEQPWNAKTSSKQEDAVDGAIAKVDDVQTEEE